MGCFTQLDRTDYFKIFTVSSPGSEDMFSKSVTLKLISIQEIKTNNMSLLQATRTKLGLPIFYYSPVKDFGISQALYLCTVNSRLADTPQLQTLAITDKIQILIYRGLTENDSQYYGLSLFWTQNDVPKVSTVMRVDFNQVTFQRSLEQILLAYVCRRNCRCLKGNKNMIGLNTACTPSLS